MIQIRLHGLGGQGIVTAAEILALAGWKEGLWAQAMPSFGPERTGAPVHCFVRFDKSKIITRSPIDLPDWLLITAEKLLAHDPTISGIEKNSRIIVNSPLTAEHLAKKYPHEKAYFLPIDASAITTELGNPLVVGSVLLGNFCARSGLLTIASLKAAIAEKLADLKPELIALNQRAAQLGYKYQ